MHDLLKITNIIPSIKTDHAAISMELVNDCNDIKGPGLWKINCCILDDEDYLNDITENIPLWLAEGRKDLSDSRSIWDWLKHNIRAHTFNFRKEKHGREMKENKIFKRNTLKRNVFLKVALTTEMQILLIGLKILWNCFMKEK